jgi:hypothetical protein
LQEEEGSQEEEEEEEAAVPWVQKAGVMCTKEIELQYWVVDGGRLGEGGGVGAETEMVGGAWIEGQLDPQFWVELHNALPLSPSVIHLYLRCLTMLVQ